MRIGIVGCGYVADYYVTKLRNHPWLEVLGVCDRDADRAERFSRHYGLDTYRDYDAMLSDDRLQIVVNLTNPRSHFETSSSALAAGKHVFSEKPLATEWSQAVELANIARSGSLGLASAPSTVLGEAAQTMWKLVRDGVIGRVRLVYAELDEGLLHRENYRSWVGPAGSPWPFKDEFEVGCTLEHAGYYVTWLAAMFGPAESVTAFASCQLPDKCPDVQLDPPTTPDFSVGCIQFRSGVVARITNSIVATHDHSLRVFGDGGVLQVDDAWDFGSPVRLDRWSKWSFRAHRYPRLSRWLGLTGRRVPLVRRADLQHRPPSSNLIDYGRGVAEFAESVRDGRPCRLGTDFSLHINEIVLSLQDPVGMGCPRQLSTTFDPIAPMPWAV